jgi:hypothetical protein
MDKAYREIQHFVAADNRILENAQLVSAAGRQELRWRAVKGVGKGMVCKSGEGERKSGEDGRMSKS